MAHSWRAAFTVEARLATARKGLRHAHRALIHIVALPLGRRCLDQSGLSAHHPLRRGERARAVRPHPARVDFPPGTWTPAAHARRRSGYAPILNRSRADSLGAHRDRKEY